MPRYFFNVQDQTSMQDSDGVELPDAHAAWEEATTACGEMIRDLDGALQAGPEWRMEVADESQKLLFRFSFRAEAFS